MADCNDPYLDFSRPSFPFKANNIVVLMQLDFIALMTINPVVRVVSLRFVLIGSACLPNR